jgi:hypothetical protein
VTPYDVYTGRHLEVIQERKEAKRQKTGHYKPEGITMDPSESGGATSRCPLILKA